MTFIGAQPLKKKKEYQIQIGLYIQIFSTGFM